MNEFMTPLYESRYKLELLMKVVQAPSVTLKEEVDKAIAEKNKPLQEILDQLNPDTYEQWKSKKEKLIAKENDEYLPIEFDDYGNYIVDGVKLDQLNIRSSIDGRFLQLLIVNKRRLIPWTELEKSVEPSELKTVRVNLRRRLKLNGLVAHTEYVKGSGLTFFGIKAAKKQ